MRLRLLILPALLSALPLLAGAVVPGSATPTAHAAALPAAPAPVHTSLDEAPVSQDGPTARSAGRPFSMVGLRWPDTPPQAEVRALRVDGSWTKWTRVQAADGADGPLAKASEPIW